MMLSKDRIKAVYEETVKNGPQPGDRYRHFKGGEYTIVCLALDSSTLEPRVVYRNDEGVVCDRSLAEFGERLGDGTHRFELIAKSPGT